MKRYDSRRNIEEYWTYRELLEMIYIEDLEAIQNYKAQKKQADIQEMEDQLNG